VQVCAHSGLAGPDHTVPYGTVPSTDAFPGTSCQATIVLSLRDALYLLDLHEAASGRKMDPCGVDRRGMAGVTIGR
jgi:hypothetical protein